MMNKPTSDLVGQRFGKLQVVSLSHSDHRGRCWKCKCDCGNDHVVCSSALTSGKTTSCGCKKHQAQPFKSPEHDLTGKRFGKLVVLQQEPSIKRSGSGYIRAWLCHCDCGGEKVVVAKDLVGGKTGSCGCAQWQKKREPYLTTALEVFQNRYSDGDLDFESFLCLSQENCHYCNEPPSNLAWREKRRHEPAYQFVYNGLDRIDNNQPHDRANVVPCCFTCNHAKSDLSIDDFHSWLKRAYEHSIVNHSSSSSPSLSSLAGVR
jgi:hypothetical protein